MSRSLSVPIGMLLPGRSEYHTAGIHLVRLPANRLREKPFDCKSNICVLMEVRRQDEAWGSIRLSQNKPGSFYSLILTTENNGARCGIHDWCSPFDTSPASDHVRSLRRARLMCGCVMLLRQPQLWTVLLKSAGFS